MQWFAWRINCEFMEESFMFSYEIRNIMMFSFLIIQLGELRKS